MGEAMSMADIGFALEAKGLVERLRDTLRLADTTIKVNTQMKLARIGSAKEALKPPTEPRGRAPSGQAFTK